MARAVIVGGTGMIGSAVARRLVEAGGQVHLVARNPARVAPDLAAAGVTFSAVDRNDPIALRSALAAGGDLLVDCACYTASHARAIVPVLGDFASTVMISSKAVYVDAAGNHSNSRQPPSFAAPVAPTQPTLPADYGDGYQSPLGYGSCKVAAEEVLLDSGHPVTVVRPSKVHGVGATKPNEWIFVKRVVDGRGVVLLAGGGQGGDHPSAAVNIAALVEAVAATPGRRVLNAADPDAPSGLEIARVVAGHLGHEWTEVLLDPDADPRLGRHPWDRRPPVRLDLSDSYALGYEPVGDYARTVAPMLDWLMHVATRGDDGARLPADFDNAYFDRMLDYDLEDAYLAGRGAVS